MSRPPIVVGGAAGRRAAAALLLAAALVPGAARAAQAPLDPAYNGGQPLPVKIGTSATLNALVPAPDGGLAGAGTAISGGRTQTFVFRRDATGAPVTAFGGGIVLGTFGDTLDQQREADAVFVEPDGHVLVAGSAGGRLFVARYAADGTLDPLFGAGGLSFQTTVRLTPRAVLARPDGRVLVAGAAETELGRQVMVVGLTAIGQIDTTWGVRGFTIVQAGQAGQGVAAASEARAMALDALGNAYVGGRRNEGTGELHGLVLKLDPSGNRLPWAEAPGTEINALSVLGDGLVVAGTAIDRGRDNAGMVARLDAGGTTVWRRVLQLDRPTRQSDPISTLSAISSSDLVVGRAGTSAVAVRVGLDGTVACTARTVLSATSGPVVAAGSVVGTTQFSQPALAALVAAPPVVDADPPATGPVEQLSKRKRALTGVADGGCAGGRAVFMSGSKRIPAGRLGPGRGPQAVRVVTRRMKGRYHLVVE